MGDITRLLESVELGDTDSSNQLFGVVYEELRGLARRKLAGEARCQTLQPTALVHEAFMRLGGGQQQWSGRKHFFGAAAEAMRRILVERARAKKRLKRGGPDRQRVDLEKNQPSVEPPSEEVLAVHDALDDFAKKYPTKAELVKLRFFAGFTNAEVAEILEVTERTVERQWAFARAWLLNRLGKQDDTN